MQPHTKRKEINKMLSDKTILHEDEFTENEYAAMRKHQEKVKDSEISLVNLFEAWRDLDGRLTVRYKNNKCFRYYESGTYRPVKYYLYTDWSDGDRHFESDFKDKADFMESINAIFSVARKEMICSGNRKITNMCGYIDSKLEYEY